DNSVAVDFVTSELDFRDNVTDQNYGLYERYSTKSGTTTTPASVDNARTFTSRMGDNASQERIAYTTATYTLGGYTGQDAWETATKQVNWDHEFGGAEAGTPKFENSGEPDFWHAPTVYEPYSDETMRVGKSTQGYYSYTSQPRKDDMVYLYVGGDPEGVSGGKDVYYMVRNASASVSWDVQPWIWQNSEFTDSGHDYFTRTAESGYQHDSIDLGADAVKGDLIEYIFKIEGPSTTSYLGDGSGVVKSTPTGAPFSYNVANSPPVAPDNPVWPANGQGNVSTTTATQLQVNTSTGPLYKYFVDPDEGDSVAEAEYIISTDWSFTTYISSGTMVKDGNVFKPEFKVNLEAGNQYFWKVRGRNASSGSDSGWGPWGNGNTFWTFSTPGGARIDGIRYYVEDGNSWTSLAEGETIYNDKDVRVVADIYPGNNSGNKDDSQLRAYYTIDGSDPNTNFENGDDNYYFTRHKDSGGNWIDGWVKDEEDGYGDYYERFEVIIPKEVHADGSEINIQLSGFDISGATIPSAQVFTYNVVNNPDEILKNDLKHNNAYANDTDSSAGNDSHLITSFFGDQNESNSYLYLLDHDGKNTDNFGLVGANKYLKDSSDDIVDIFTGDSPKIYLRTEYNEDPEANFEVKLHYYDQNPPGTWRETELKAVYPATHLTAEGFSLDGVDDEDPYNTPYSDTGENQEYRRFTFWETIDDWNEGNPPAAGEMEYYFEINKIGGDDTQLGSKTNPFSYTVLPADLSRPYIPWDDVQTYTEYLWRPTDTFPRGGFHSIRSVYRFSAELYDDVEASQTHESGQHTYNFPNAGHGGEDSGLYIGDIDDTGSINSEVHDTRVYYIISSTAPEEANTVVTPEGLSFSTDTCYFSGTLSDAGSDVGCLILNDAVLGGNTDNGTPFDAYDADRDGYGYVQADSVPSGAGGPVNFSLLKAAGVPIDEAYMNEINGLPPGDTSSDWERKYVYYRIFVCNDDDEPMAYPSTSYNRSTNIGKRDDGNFGKTINHHDLIGEPFSKNDRDANRDHGWVMFPRYGGLIMRPPTVKITATVSISGTTKSVITYLKVNPTSREIGEVISTHIGPETEE
ncbi:MAG: hypothetical protein U9R36_01170, partial [Elusimicrobiota bacterium]|nr:hypothetical protein [Elusimicrobiota bacterium]